MKTFVTADLHFNHKAVLDFERTQFKNIEDHNNYIIKEYNKIVKKEDIVYILGDLGFYDVKKLATYVRKLNGHKILIRGNHDIFSKQDAKDMGFEEIFDHPIYYNENIILSHEPVMEAYQNPYVINVHGHLHGHKLKCLNYFNVNIAQTHYKPIDINYYVRKANELCNSRFETYGHEWYQDEYIDVI